MVYISTSCYRYPKDLWKVLDLYHKNGIRKIELGSMHSHIDDISKVFSYKRDYGTEFIIHGFFPPTKKPFFMNPASEDKKILSETMRIAKDAIDLSRKLEAKHYGLHGGYWQDISIDQKPIGKVTHDPKILDRAFANIAELCDHAAAYGIKIAIENMLSRDTLLFSEPSHFDEMFKKISARNLGVLLDLGHATCNQQLNGIMIRDMIRSFRGRILEMHTHQVNSGKDHNEITKDSILRGSGLRRQDLKKAAITLEVNNCTMSQIMSSRAVLSHAIDELK